MKDTIKIYLGAFFFILAMVTFTFLKPAPATCISQPAITINMFITLIGIFFLCTSGVFIILFFRDFEKMNIIGIIPARMSSTRFPGKPLAKINGIPMLEHVYLNCKKCKSLDAVYIATPDKEIKDYMEKGTAEVIMTSDKHERATDRVAEALQKIEQNTKKQIDIVVMIQGDEPMVTSQMIDEALQPLLHNQVQITNLMSFIKTKKETQDKNTIKVVVDKKDNALYFSRSQIPYNPVGVGCKQVCVMAFNRNKLLQFSQLEPTFLEKLESVDMLRFVEHGIKVKMVETKTETHAVDVPSDIKIVEKLM